MSGRPLLLVTLPVLTVLAICLYLRQRGRQDCDPPEPLLPDQPASEPTTQQQTAAKPAARQTAEPAAVQPTAEAAAEPAAAAPATEQTAPATEQAAPAAEQAAPAAEQTAPAAEQTAGRDLGQVTAWVRDNIETRPVAEETAAVRAEAAAVSAAPPAAVRGEPEGSQEGEEKAPEPAAVGAGGDALRELEAAVLPAQTDEQDRGDRGVRPRLGSEGLKNETPATEEEVPVAAEGTQDVAKEVEVSKETPVAEVEATVTLAKAPVTLEQAPVTSEEAPLAKEETQVAETQPAAAAQEAAVAAETAPATPAPASGAEASEPSVNGAAETGADTASENSSDSGKGGSSTSLEQASPSTSPESAPLQNTVYDFLIPQKLCGRLIGKNGTFVNMLKARTGAHVIIRLHPVKSSVKICSVDGTQSEVDACLKMIREKFPVNKFPAMTLEQLNRPTEQTLAVPDSQQLHLSQGVTCDVLVSAVVSAGQLFLQQHTHPTFRGLERLTTLMAACYADGSATPELPRPVLASSICAAPVAGGWYRAQVVAFYPDSDELDVRFMDFGGYSRIPAAHARQIRTDFMSLPFQAEECYLANVMPVSEDGWSLEAGAVFESLITDRALEAMVVGYAEDGTPFVNLYSIQGTEYGNNAISLVNQQLVESGAARWVENQA